MCGVSHVVFVIGVLIHRPKRSVSSLALYCAMAWSDFPKSVGVWSFASRITLHYRDILLFSSKAKSSIFRHTILKFPWFYFGDSVFYKNLFCDPTDKNQSSSYHRSLRWRWCLVENIISVNKHLITIIAWKTFLNNPPVLLPLFF